MDTWDIRSLDVQPHSPQVLRSDKEARLIAIHLPAGEELQEHQVHERAYLLVAEGEIDNSRVYVWRNRPVSTDSPGTGEFLAGTPTGLCGGG